ncbi:DUF6929 family protein [Porphyrobacter sp. ULC335]|uniref:DUF6929 family protein n=1 Tax=Porphyrobacter sp. ULC335 TaxID=2854260 RepID=UPI00221F0E7C|nr:hypothetical protein [Porphyrobacter sp. ULC335]UYV17002.1 hypothetical protein KVF90_06835 [Porphyrobacter sp. ULC335]
MHLTHLRDLAVDTPLPSGHAFLSAASGMVVCGSALYVVADDAQCLGVFDLGTGEPGRLIPLIAGELPKDAVERKKQKPDFEILLALPCAGATRLLAMGSGSTSQRMRGALIDLPDHNAPASVRLIDLQALFAAIAPLVPEINLEGAVLRCDQLLLFNRGNMEYPASQIIAVPLSALLEGGPITATLHAELQLPTVSGVPLTVTDACLLESGHILLSAVAEATDNSYADGALLGAAIVELDANLNVRVIEPLDPILKVEGLSAQIMADGVHLLCVTDADDPDAASSLYRRVLGARA